MKKSGSDVYLNVDVDAYGGTQVSINSDVSGYRIDGPKYTGNSRNVRRKELTAQDIAEIRSYLKIAARNIRKRNV